MGHFVRLGTIFLFLLLTSCQPNVSEPTLPEKSISIEPERETPIQEEKIKPLTELNGDFEQIIGWLTDQEILYITRIQSNYLLNAYHVESGENRTLLTITEPIIEVRIHPSLTKIAVVTSSNSLSASIQIFSTAGEELDKLTIESSELYWDWHPTQTNDIFFSAFYEDWTFDSFVYSSNTKEMKRIETNDPFGKWGKESSIYTINWPENDTLSGGSLREINTVDMTSKDSDSNIIYVEAADGVEVTVSISNDQQNFLYTLVRHQDGKSTTFELPAISNYSQWFVPNIEWLRDGTMLTYESSKAGLMDEIPSEFNLVQLSIDKPKNTILEGRYESFACNPSGRICLTGVQLEKLLEVESGKIHSWITLGE
ncbi:hypothetical protein [Paenisporosarcina sp.]|uniref:YqgU-like beta propeller domain-containing protein n=1 Tax=Paenisporosarcina sp. TaxID=1932001 RepID=UPI003C742F7B